MGGVRGSLSDHIAQLLYRPNGITMYRAATHKFNFSTGPQSNAYRYVPRAKPHNTAYYVSVNSELSVMGNLKYLNVCVCLFPCLSVCMCRTKSLNSVFIL